jgi:hypothetical protein
VASLPIESIGALRVREQRIAGQAFASSVEAVRHMCAMQGQDWPGVKWSIGLRVRDAREQDIDAAFNDRSLVRSWPMRGTLHVTLAEDLPWMLALLASRVIASTKTRRTQLGLDDESLLQARKVAENALATAGQLTRDALLQCFVDAGIETTGQRGYHILFHLSLEGVLCLGPAQGKEQCFVLLDAWIRKPRVLSREAALHELTLRYFTSHGPATMHDFIGWSKLTAGDAKHGLASCGTELVQRTCEGTNYWMHASSEARLLEPFEKSFALLPGFDEFVLGYKARDAVLDPAHFEKIVPGNNGMFMPTLVRDGRVIGTWKKAPKKHFVDLEVEPFVKLLKSDHNIIEIRAKSYAHFLGKEVRVVSA